MAYPKLAIYDVDYTIIPCSAFTELVIDTLRKYPAKLRFLPWIFFLFILQKINLVSLEKFKQSWLLLFRSFKAEKLKDYTENFSRNNLIPRLKDGVLEDIESNRKNGYKIVLATASFEFSVVDLSNYLKADYLFATGAAGVNDRLQARIVGNYCYGTEKVKRISETIVEHDISASISYSDNESDIHFLDLTGRFNLIRKKEWKIISVTYRPHVLTPLSYAAS
uniref:Phosphoserine phosphatase n=1 Tax=Candidatus Kentrum eta TaxID=2126337 RepID=A0A450VBK7_9GAMM|nr:MAG: Phosphoserine phosphatase [Candidatus Kentron sp. H]VFK02176.1 MAG: Phosphoserine phosphatase [Candidatus Kentron sp. H]VFK04617.1 MAG: Phosphoserine phosphatase [Candidatus Kentron sp. H]